MLEEARNDAEALSKSLSKLVEVSDALAGAEAKLSATNKTLAETSKALEDKKRLLDQNRQEALAEFDKTMFEKTKLLRELVDGIKLKTTEYGDLTAQVNTLRKQHDEILASIESMKKRFA